MTEQLTVERATGRLLVLASDLLCDGCPWIALVRVEQVFGDAHGVPFIRESQADTPGGYGGIGLFVLLQRPQPRCMCGDRTQRARQPIRSVQQVREECKHSSLQ
jgi:hypothetical protein